ncbi:MAG: type II toxin-antitoxin system VapC family toxin [Alphaproteobacteria bacterium]|nr:type II toxin-antitoxin system VapC family toxin [Alphaproteobacteria bacterium]
MRLLLDTNILIPIARRKATQLKNPIRAAIRDSGNRLFVSVVSLWEIAIKFRIDKLDVMIEAADLPDLLVEFGMGLLVIEAAHVLADLEVGVDTRDPFDRLLLAQCQVENLRLVTVDPKLLTHPLAWRTR